MEPGICFKLVTAFKPCFANKVMQSLPQNLVPIVNLNPSLSLLLGLRSLIKGTKNAPLGWLLV